MASTVKRSTEKQSPPNVVKSYKDDGYTLVHYDYNPKYLNIKEVEREYQAEYIGEFSVKGADGDFVNGPISVFYSIKKHSHGSNYFGMYFSGDRIMITNAISAIENEWIGILDEKTKTILYSAYRHDMQTHTPEGGDYMMIDGGSGGYIRTSLGPTVKFTVDENGVKVIPK